MNTPLLKINELRVAVDGKLLKDSISFLAEPGKVVRIIGRNGAGKTTLIKTILGFQPRSAREVHFNMPMTLGDSISYFPQAWGDTLLPWLNAWENILLGTINSSSSCLGNLICELSWQFFPEVSSQNCLDKASPSEKFDAIKRYLASQDITKLSGGQQEKIVLLRTLICNPRLLLIDEPYRDLDFESTMAVNMYLDQFVQQGNILVYVSHQNVGLDPDIVVNMD